MSSIAIGTDTTELKKGMTLTYSNYMARHLVTWARLQKKKIPYVIADTDALLHY